jgi:hypothetical protein
MKVAAYQAPLLPGGSMEALRLIRDRVKWCGPRLVRLVRYSRCPRNGPAGGRDVVRGHPRHGGPRQKARINARVTATLVTLLEKPVGAWFGDRDSIIPTISSALLWSGV